MLRLKYLFVLVCFSAKVQMIIRSQKNLQFSFLFQSLEYFDFQVQTCEQNGGNKSLIDYSGLKVRKVKGVRKLFGDVIYHISMDNTIGVEGYAYIKQGGEYRRLPFKIPRKQFCKFFYEEIYFYPEFAKASDFPPPETATCPLPNVRNIFCLFTRLRFITEELNMLSRKLITLTATNRHWQSCQKLFFIPVTTQRSLSTTMDQK